MHHTLGATYSSSRRYQIGYFGFGGGTTSASLGVAARTALAIVAGRDRSQVENPAKNDEGLIVGLTYPEARAWRRAGMDRATAGAIALGEGT